MALLLAAYVLTRAAVLLVARSRALYPYQDDPFEIGVFVRWGAAFTGDGAPVPLVDGPWEYPAGAVPVVLAPALLPGLPYVAGFVGQMVLWDAAVLAVLVVVGRHTSTWTGAWLWIAAVPLLGPVALTRFDVVPTALAVGGLAALTAAPALAGVLLAAGGLVKLWPGLLVPLVLALVPAPRRLVVGSVATGVVALLAVGLSGAAPQLFSFLTYQRDRGLEVEAVPALPLMLARALGDERMSTGFAFGSNQVDGPWAPAMLAVSTAGTAVVVVAVALLTLRARRAGAEVATSAVALAALLLAGVLLFDKVLSAQYPLWLAGIVALSLSRPGSPLRPARWPLVGALALTQSVYPLLIDDLVDTAALTPVLLLAARAVLLVVLVALLARACWRLGTVRTAGSR